MRQSEAYELAQQTGQIAIRKQTAKALASIARLDEAVTEVCDAITAIYPEGAATEEIAGRIHEAYSILQSEALTLLANHMILESMSYIEFGGL